LSSSVFVEAEFFLLIIFSFILPAGIYGYMIRKKAMSRKIVLILGLTLIGISGVSVFLLQRLKTIANSSPSFLDHQIFSSEVSLALYLLPALFAGIGINIISHLLITHLEQAEKQFDQENP
jgi:hypothetical protein